MAVSIVARQARVKVHQPGGCALVRCALPGGPARAKVRARAQTCACRPVAKHVVAGLCIDFDVVFALLYAASSP